MQATPLRRWLAMNLLESFAQVLKGCRTKLGLTQKDVALRSGLHVNFISRMELAKAQPTLDSLFAIARALEEEPENLVVATKALTKPQRRLPRPKKSSAE